MTREADARPFTPVELAKIREHVAYMETLVYISDETAQEMRRQLILEHEEASYG